MVGVGFRASGSGVGPTTAQEVVLLVHGLPLPFVSLDVPGA